MRLECRERLPWHRLQRKPLVSDPGMHHDTCVTQVLWCMLGSLTRGGGENVPAFPAHAQPAILRIWQEAHGRTRLIPFVLYFTYQIWTKYPSIGKCISFNRFGISLNFGEFHWICSEGPTVHEISICSNIVWNLIVTTTCLHNTHTSTRARYRMSCWARSCNKASYRILKRGHGRVINETTPYCNSLVVMYTYYFLSVVGAKSVIQQSYEMVWAHV